MKFLMQNLMKILTAQACNTLSYLLIPYVVPTQSVRSQSLYVVTVLKVRTVSRI